MQVTWPSLTRLPSWSERKFAILKHERDVWHKLALDARDPSEGKGWSDQLRKDLKDLYKVDIAPETIEREDSTCPLVSWEHLKRGVTCENGAVCVEKDKETTTTTTGRSSVPLFKVRSTTTDVNVNVNVNPQKSQSPPVLLYFYGGGYTVGTADGSISFMLKMSKAMENATVFTIDYKKSPEHSKFPFALQEALSAWDHLTETLGIPADRICLAGDSAGGSLSFGVTLFLRDHKRPLPAGAILICPWLELTHSLPSNIVNQPHDYLTVPFGPLSPSFNSQYCCTDDQLFHPYLSAVYDKASLPASFKVLDQVGGADTLMDDGLVWALQQHKQGATVRLEIYADEVHDFQVFIGDPDFPLSQLAVDRMGVFFKSLFKGEEGIVSETLFFAPDSKTGSGGVAMDGLALLESEFVKLGQDKGEARRWIEKRAVVKLRPPVTLY